MKNDFEKMGQKLGKQVSKSLKNLNIFLKKVDKEFSEEKVNQWTEKVEKTISEKVPLMVDDAYNCFTEVLDDVKKVVKDAQNEYKKENTPKAKQSKKTKKKTVKKKVSKKSTKKKVSKKSSRKKEK